MALLILSSYWRAVHGDIRGSDLRRGLCRSKLGRIGLNRRIFQVEMRLLLRIVKSCANVTFVRKGVGRPFFTYRAFWTHNIAGGVFGGAHAFMKQHELLAASSGSFDVFVSSGVGDRWFSRNGMVTE